MATYLSPNTEDRLTTSESDNESENVGRPLQTTSLMATLDPPASGAFLVYLGAGKPRDGGSLSVAAHARIGGPYNTFEVDLKIGGYDHYLNHPSVQ